MWFELRILGSQGSQANTRHGPISGIQNVNCSAWRRYALYRVPFLFTLNCCDQSFQCDLKIASWQAWFLITETKLYLEVNIVIMEYGGAPYGEMIQGKNGRPFKCVQNVMLIYINKCVCMCVRVCEFVCHGVSSCIIVYHRVSSCIIVYARLSLCIIVYRCVSLFIVVYHCVPLCILVYHCVSSCIIVYPCVSLCTIVYPRA